MYVHGSVSVRGRRVGWHGACETVGRFRPRMPSLGACGAVGPEIRVEVLRRLLFEMGLLFVAGTGGFNLVHVISTSSLSMFSLSQGRLSQRRCY